MNDAEDSPLPYFAGLFDGEGTVTLINCNYHGYLLRVCLTNTHEGVIQLLKNRFGGSIQYRDRKCATYRPTWNWQITHQRAIDFLLAIEPWVVVKKQQMEVVRAWRELLPGKGAIGRRGPRERYDEAQKMLYLRMKWLNAKGPRQEGQPEPLLDHDKLLAAKISRPPAGVSYRGEGKWLARLWCKTKWHNIGQFTTAEEASAAYMAARLARDGAASDLVTNTDRIS